jgi:Flp pilus assembly pilin Flp
VLRFEGALEQRTIMKRRLSFWRTWRNTLTAITKGSDAWQQPGISGWQPEAPGAIRDPKGNSSQVESDTSRPPEVNMVRFARMLWAQEDGQDIAEYAVMLAVILVIVVGTIRLIGSNTNTVFSNVASTLQ